MELRKLRFSIYLTVDLDIFKPFFGVVTRRDKVKKVKLKIAVCVLNSTTFRYTDDCTMNKALQKVHRAMQTWTDPIETMRMMMVVTITITMTMTLVLSVKVTLVGLWNYHRN